MFWFGKLCKLSRALLDKHMYNVLLVDNVELNMVFFSKIRVGIE